MSALPQPGRAGLAVTPGPAGASRPARAALAADQAAPPAGCSGPGNTAVDGNLRPGEPCPNACADGDGAVLLEPVPLAGGGPGELWCPRCQGAFGEPRP